jgi:hypothetical protein
MLIHSLILIDITSLFIILQRIFFYQRNYFFISSKKTSIDIVDKGKMMMLKHIKLMLYKTYTSIIKIKQYFSFYIDK